MRKTLIWTTRDNRKMTLNQMDNDHLRNLKKFLDRKPYGTFVNGQYTTSWCRAIRAELKARRNTPAKPMFDIKDFIYNETKGVSTLLVDDQAITIQLSDDCEHDPYAAFTALVTKYVMGSQSAIVREVGKMKTIKPVGPAPTNELSFFMPDWNTMMNILAKMEVDD